MLRLVHMGEGQSVRNDCEVDTMSGKPIKPGRHTGSKDNWQIQYMPKQEVNSRPEISSEKKEAIKRKRKQQKKSRRNNR